MAELHHGSYVSVYSQSGHFECRGHIVGIYGLNPEYYDVQPAQEYSLKRRMCGIPAARVRAHYVAPYLVETNKHINDLV